MPKPASATDRAATADTITTADPYGHGWLVKIKIEPGTKLDHLLTQEQYQKQIASEEH